MRHLKFDKDLNKYPILKNISFQNLHLKNQKYLQLFSNIQNFLKVDLNEKNNNLNIDNKNLQDKSKYYKDYLSQNNSLSTEQIRNIISMVENNDLSELENRRMISILKKLADEINDNFIGNFDLNITTELKDYKPKLASIIEKIFSYLIVLNVFIFIFLKYFKFNLKYFKFKKK